MGSGAAAEGNETCLLVQGGFLNKNHDVCDEWLSLRLSMTKLELCVYMCVAVTVFFSFVYLRPSPLLSWNWRRADIRIGNPIPGFTEAATQRRS